MKSLREAAEERGWKIDWTDLDAAFAKAKAKASEKRYAEAIRIQSKVVINLMAQIRKQRNENTSDSSVDL